MKPYVKYRQQFIGAAVMALGGLSACLLSYSYVPPKIMAVNVQPVKETLPVIETTSEETEEVSVETEAETETEAAFVPDPTQLNLAFFYPEGSDENDILNSYAGNAFKELTIMDSEWLSGIYDLADLTPEAMASRLKKSVDVVRGYYNPDDEAQKADDPDSWKIHSWKNVKANFYDGNGKQIGAYSNVKDILSMANVYTYYTNMEDHETFLSYAKALWKSSHSFSYKMSDVYFCEGCLNKKEADAVDIPQSTDAQTTSTVGEEGEVSAETAEDGSGAQDGSGAEDSTSTEDAIVETAMAALASPSDAQASAIGKILEGFNSITEQTAVNCPGHIDLIITATILGIDEKKGLVSKDKTAAKADDTGLTSWTGWTEENLLAARTLSEKDWYADYNLTVSSLCISNPLSPAEIDAYLNQLPQDLSSERKEIIRFALNSVGRVPYYWGGKPSTTDYIGNYFGTIVTPDLKGRNMKGLDCSGWVNWVYWSATGNRLDFEGTDGLSQIGTAVSRDDMNPGDIMVRLGENAHVMMFLGWESDGRMKVIHETSGATNNVTVGTVDVKWPYYRSLIN